MIRIQVNDYVQKRPHPFGRNGVLAYQILLEDFKAEMVFNVTSLQFKLLVKLLVAPLQAALKRYAAIEAGFAFEDSEADFNFLDQKVPQDLILSLLFKGVIWLLARSLNL